MSLINKLLQDLEQRQGSGAHNEPMSAEIRSVLRPSRRVGWLVPTALVLPVVAAAGLWMLMSGRTSQPVVASAPAPQMAAKPAPTTVAAATPPAAVSAAPTVAPAVAPATAAVAAPMAVPAATVVAATPQLQPVKAAEPKAFAALQPMAQPAPVPAPKKPVQVAVAKAPEATPATPGKSPVAETPAAPPKSPVAEKPAIAPKPPVAEKPATMVAVAAPAAPTGPAPAAKPMQSDLKVVTMTGVVKRPLAGADQAAPEAAPEKPAVRTASAETQSQKTVSPQQLSDNLYKRAVVLAQQGRSKDARQALTESLAAVPRNAQARQLLVSLYVEAHSLAEASALLREGVKLSPDHSGLWMNLARLQLENGDTNGATATLEQGLSSAPEDGAYNAFYAALMQRAGRHDVAVKHYLAALRIEPGMPNWLVGVGISFQALGKENDAAEAFQRAKDGGQLPPAFIAFVDQRLTQLRRQ